MINKQIDIYNDIFLNILSQKYSPNTVLKERDLALKYRTSRTTIRAILQKLSHENKIIINPRSKTFVKKINLERIQQSFLLRQCLEITVASMILKKIQNKDLQYLLENIQNQKKLLVKYNKNKNKKYINLDNQFHSYLFKICGLEAFWKIITEYNFDFDRLRHISAYSKQRCVESTDEHLKIYKAIKTKKTSVLKQAIKSHFKNSKEYYKGLIKFHKEIIE
tara:strand:+ start:3596 stop:4258 length:663 start_codon:yes stop_codon:yes gene_type:complete